MTYVLIGFILICVGWFLVFRVVEDFMPVRKRKNGWLVEVDRKGIPRIRKLLKDKAEAEIFEREYLAKYQLIQQQNSDKRTLKELIDAWFIYHGINLSDGDRRKTKLLAMCAELNNPVACDFTAEQFVLYRYKKLNTNERTISAKTFNNLHGYLSAVYSKLRKLKVIDYESPVSEVDFIKIQERQLSYLNKNQIDILLESIMSGCTNKSTWYVTQICLRTGARWSEAEQLTRKQLYDGRITFEFTKSKKTRTVPIESSFYQKIINMARHKNPDDRLFDNCISAFRRAVYRTELDLPTGQMTHILRHTFASYFIMNGGNILTLQRILGHSDITMTMRYAHLSPDHLADAIKLNPMN